MNKLKPLAAFTLTLAIAVSATGCMTSRGVTKNVATGLAPIIDALARDTNACRLQVNAFGVMVLFERNVWGLAAPPAIGGGGVTLTPETTLRVQPAK